MDKEIYKLKKEQHELLERLQNELIRFEKGEINIRR